jgi:hypothetical protein
VTSGLYSRADKEIATDIREALRANPSAGHRIVRADDEPLETSFAAADLLVCDVSAVATAWLTTGRPLVVTLPASPHAAPADSGLIAAVPRLSAEQARDAAELLWREHVHDTAAESRGRLADYYFAETGSDEPAAKFITACTELIAIRDTARMKLLEMGGGAV